MRARRATREHRRSVGFDGDDFHRRIARLQHFTDAGDRTARAHARDEEIHFAVGIAPDFFGGGFAVDSGIGRIGELLENDGAGDFGGEFLGLGDGAFHALGALGEHEPRAEDFEQFPALGGHRLGHGEDEFEAFGRGDEGERDARVAGSRLDEDGVLGDFTAAERLVDHGEPDAVLHARERIEKLEFEQDLRLRTVCGRGAVEPHERGVADRFRDVVVYFSHGRNELVFRGKLPRENQIA